jgi:hypothetical protein
LPDLFAENRLVYEVYWRMFGAIENQDAFKIMDTLGIKPDERLYCLDLIQAAKGEVMRDKQIKKVKK